MKLKNNKGKERNFDLLLKIEKDKKVYLVYRDPISNKIYSGKKEDNTLKVLDEKEIEFINKIMDKFN